MEGKREGGRKEKEMEGRRKEGWVGTNREEWGLGISQHICIRPFISQM